MLRSPTLTIAVATCAAAPLTGASGAGEHPASVEAAARLARHGVLDAQAALTAPDSLRRRRLARARRRLAYAYALTARLLNEHAPAGSRASAIFSQAASEIASAGADLAARTDGRAQTCALGVLRRAAQLQSDVAAELATARSAGSIEDLRDALATASDAQDKLLVALDRPTHVSRHQLHALKLARTRAHAARDALRVALLSARNAVHDTTALRSVDDPHAPDHTSGPPAAPVGLPQPTPLDRRIR